MMVSPTVASRAPGRVTDAEKTVPAGNVRPSVSNLILPETYAALGVNASGVVFSAVPFART